MIFINSQRFGSTPWPLDYLGGELASWGVYALRKSMVSQPAMDIRRGSDSTDLTVNFKTDGTLDTAAAVAFFGSDRKAVKTWYDQSGNANHFVQTTDALKPGFSIPTPLALPLVEFEFGQDAYPIGLANSNKTFALSPGFNLSSATGYTCYTVILLRDRTADGMSTFNGVGNVVYGDGGGNPLLITEGYAQSGVTPNFRLWRGGSFADISPYRAANLRPSVLVQRLSDGTPKNILTSDAVHHISATPSNVFEQTLTNFGIAGGFNTTGVSLLACIFYSGIHSDEQVATMAGLLQKRFGYLAPTYQIFFAGDSLSAERDSTTAYDDRLLSWPYQLISSMGLKDARATNVAVSGRTIAQAEGWDTGFVDAEYNAAYSKHVLTVCLGTNDIYFGANAATAYSSLKSYCDNRRTAGWTNILVCTIPPRQNFDVGQEVIRQAFNTLILANGDSAFDAVADVASQNWQPSGVGDWTTNYQDGVHPNAAGRTLFVNAVQPVLAGLL